MKAHAKINLALVVGPRRVDGLHEVVTLMQRIDLHDDVTLEPAPGLEVDGFANDTIVSRALLALAESASATPGWRVTIHKRIPVAAGLGGGSSDAAAALILANGTLVAPLSPVELHAVAAGVGVDVPFFLYPGAQLATGSGTELVPVRLPQDYVVVLVVPEGVEKESTGAVYEAFDARRGADGFDARAAQLRDVVDRVSEARDLADLPSNDLASSPLSAALLDLGAFRADVSGAGPTVYGLFIDASVARRAADAIGEAGETVVARPL